MLGGFAALGALGALPGCAALPALDTLVGGEDILLDSDIAYGPAERQRLGVYRPRDIPPGAPLPVLVAFHGGFWQFGNRDELQMHLLGQRLAARGIVVVLAGYRLYPEAAFPAFVEDGALAVAWAARHARRFGGDPRLVFAAGHSAGAHIAVLLALDRRYLDAHGVGLAGAIGIAGPYGSWFQDNGLVAGAFPPALRRESSPIAIAHGGGAPLLLLGAGLDLLVPPRDSTELAARVRAAGGLAEARIYPAATHTSIVLPLLPGTVQAHEDTAAFIRSTVTAMRAGTRIAEAQPMR